MKIVISPYSQKLRNGKENPKNWPYWNQIISELNKSHNLIQIGVEGEKKLTEDCRFNLLVPELVKLANEMDLFISVDNFAHHFFHYQKKYGIVIFTQSDPKLFGYKENINLVDEKYLRTDQYGQWESCEYKKEAFIHPDNILVEVDNFYYKKLKKENYKS